VDLVTKKGICTKEKHKFSSPWEGAFMEIAALGVMCWQKSTTVCSPIREMLISCANTMSDVFI
jgi:hypothetical protein